MITVKLMDGTTAVYPDAYAANVRTFSGVLEIVGGKSDAKYGQGSWVTYWFGSKQPFTKEGFKKRY